MPILSHHTAQKMFEMYEQTADLQQVLHLLGNYTFSHKTTLRQFFERLNEQQLQSVIRQQAETLDQHKLIASLVFTQIGTRFYTNVQLLEEGFQHAYKCNNANAAFVDNMLFFWGTAKETFPLMVQYLNKGDQNFKKECQKKLAYRVCNLQEDCEHIMFNVAPHLTYWNSGELFDIWKSNKQHFPELYSSNAKNVAQAIAVDDTYNENRIGLAHRILQHICDFKPSFTPQQTQLLHETMNRVEGIATKHALNQAVGQPTHAINGARKM